MGAQRALAYVGVTSSVQSHRSVSALPSLTNPRLLVCEPSRQWRDQVVGRLNELCRLTQGWNGYGAPPVNFDTANFAHRALEVICASDMPAPQIVPGPNGDLQFEWHLLGGDIEVHVQAPNRVHAWRGSDRLDDDGEELLLTNDFTVLGAWMKELVESTRAVEAAAA